MFKYSEKTKEKFLFFNWKMNLNYNESEKLLKKIVDFTKSGQKIIKGQLGIFPQMAALSKLAQEHSNFKNIYFGSQNIHHESFGAYTGESSAAMISSLGCKYALIGHSERRALFGENETINKKIEQAVKNNLIPILCVGETSFIDSSSDRLNFIKNQVDQALEGLEVDEIIIAYEPVWAIGTGKSADISYICEIFEAVKNHINNNYSNKIKNCSYIYGGSCNEKNFDTYLSTDYIDGLLIGGASLDFEKVEIIVEKTLF